MERTAEAGWRPRVEEPLCGALECRCQVPQSGVMTLCDYFSAPDDEAAVAVLGTPGGPIPAGLDAVSLKHVDPVVVLGRLETLMTAAAVDAYGGGDGGSGAADAGGADGDGGRASAGALLVSTPDGEGPLVFRLPDALTAVLASATPDDLARAAGPWSLTPELRQFQVDEATAAAALDVLAALVRRARDGGLRVYCWWAL